MKTMNVLDINLFNLVFSDILLTSQGRSHFTLFFDEESKREQAYRTL